MSIDAIKHGINTAITETNKGVELAGSANEKLAEVGGAIVGLVEYLDGYKGALTLNEVNNANDQYGQAIDKCTEGSKILIEVGRQTEDTALETAMSSSVTGADAIVKMFNGSEVLKRHLAYEVVPLYEQLIEKLTAAGGMIVGIARENDRFQEATSMSILNAETYRDNL